MFIYLFIFLMRENFKKHLFKQLIAGDLNKHFINPMKQLICWGLVSGLNYRFKENIGYFKAGPIDMLVTNY